MPYCRIRIVCGLSPYQHSTLVVRAMSRSCFYRFVVAVIRVHTAESPFDSTQTDSAAAILSGAPVSIHLQWF